MALITVYLFLLMGGWQYSRLLRSLQYAGGVKRPIKSCVIFRSIYTVTDYFYSNEEEWPRLN